MDSTVAIILLAVVTILSFIFLRPRGRPALGNAYWNAQTLPAIELAKTFSFRGDTDRLIEMLRLKPLLVPRAKEFIAAAASTGIPMLYHRFPIPWQQTEEIIDSLLYALDDVPEDVIHAFSVLGLGKYLNGKEDQVVLRLIDLLYNTSISTKILIKTCEALGHIHNPLAVEPLEAFCENIKQPELVRAAEKALRQLGVKTEENHQKSNLNHTA